LPPRGLCVLCGESPTWLNLRLTLPARSMPQVDFVVDRILILRYIVNVDEHGTFPIPVNEWSVPDDQ